MSKWFSCSPFVTLFLSRACFFNGWLLSVLVTLKTAWVVRGVYYICSCFLICCNVLSCFQMILSAEYVWFPSRSLNRHVQWPHQIAIITSQRTGSVSEAGRLISGSPVVGWLPLLRLRCVLFHLSHLDTLTFLYHLVQVCLTWVFFLPPSYCLSHSSSYCETQEFTWFLTLLTLGEITASSTFSDSYMNDFWLWWSICLLLSLPSPTLFYLFLPFFSFPAF